MLEFRQTDGDGDFDQVYTEIADIKAPDGVLGGGAAVAQVCIIASSSRDVSVGYYEGGNGVADGSIYAWWESLPNVKTAYEIAAAIEVAALSGTMYYEAGSAIGVLKPYRQYLGGIPCGKYDIED